MDLKAATRRGGSLLAGDDMAERVAVLASITMAGTSFGPGLLPRPGLDQALATGIVAATNHGLVMTSQSACAGARPAVCPRRWDTIGPGAGLRDPGSRKRGYGGVRRRRGASPGTAAW